MEKFILVNLSLCSNQCVSYQHYISKVKHEKGGSVLVKYSSKTFYESIIYIEFSGFTDSRMNGHTEYDSSRITPGNCWPMVGSYGYVVLSLAFPVRPTMFTLEHLPKTLSFDGQSRSAPKEFSVRGLNSSNHEREFLARFMYDTTTISSSPIQTLIISVPNTAGRVQS